MAAPSVQTISTLLQTGTYPVTLKWFTVEQPDERRKYPSVEIVDIKPTGTTETDKDVNRERSFEIRIYQKTVGQHTTPTDDQTEIEQTIIALIETETLEDHKIILERKDWTRTPHLTKHPHYLVSTLRVFTQLKTITPSADGNLVFDLSESTVDLPPGTDYTYTECFDTTFDDGYRDVEEQVTSNPDGTHLPVFFTGGYSGTFVTSVYVKTADLGTTGEKLNKLNRLRSIGEKGTIGFIYTNKDANTTPTTIQEMYKVRVDRVTRVYSTGDVTYYRITGHLISPSVIT